MVNTLCEALQTIQVLTLGILVLDRVSFVEDYPKPLCFKNRSPLVILNLFRNLGIERLLGVFRLLVEVGDFRRKLSIRCEPGITR